ncbi:MAG: hypothetical protein HY561_03010 [Gemmatimonadetes bacterium]|nr:hypothetical protein [Gemmatimonadota bacterium]
MGDVVVETLREREPFLLPEAERGVIGDARDAGGKLRLEAEAGQAAVHLQEHVLAHLLAVRRVRHQPEDHVAHPSASASA